MGVCAVWTWTYMHMAGSQGHGCMGVGFIQDIDSHMHMCNGLGRHESKLVQPRFFA